MLISDTYIFEILRRTGRFLLPKEHLMSKSKKNKNSKVDFLAMVNELEEKVDIPRQQITRSSDLAKNADLRHLYFWDF